MKNLVKKTLIGMCVIGALMPVLVSCGEKTPVDKLLDLDQQFLDEVQIIAEQLEKEEMFMGDWVFTRLDELYVKFAPQFGEFDWNSITDKQRNRAKKLAERKEQLEIKLCEVGFSPGDNGRYNLKLHLTNLEHDNELDFVLDRLENGFTSVSSTVSLLSERKMEEEEAMPVFKSVTKSVLVFPIDFDLEDPSLTQEQLYRIEQLGLYIDEFSWLFE